MNKIVAACLVNAVVFKIRRVQLSILIIVPTTHQEKVGTFFMINKKFPDSNTITRTLLPSVQHGSDSSSISCNTFKCPSDTPHY